jgi:hypothetical protein
MSLLKLIFHFFAVPVPDGQQRPKSVIWEYKGTLRVLASDQRT